MRSDHTNHGLPAEFFVVQLDGHIKSTHGRFVEALRQALSLRNEFPQHEVKVRATPATVPHGDIKRRTILH
jgi:hypothetical protein